MTILERLTPEILETLQGKALAIPELSHWLHIAGIPSMQANARLDWSRARGQFRLDSDTIDAVTHACENSCRSYKSFRSLRGKWVGPRMGRKLIASDIWDSDH